MREKIKEKNKNNNLNNGNGKNIKKIDNNTLNNSKSILALS